MMIARTHGNVTLCVHCPPCSFAGIQKIVEKSPKPEQNAFWGCHRGGVKDWSHLVQSLNSGHPESDFVKCTLAIFQIKQPTRCTFVGQNIFLTSRTCFDLLHFRGYHYSTEWYLWRWRRRSENVRCVKLEIYDPHMCYLVGCNISYRRFWLKWKFGPFHT